MRHCFQFFLLAAGLSLPVPATSQQEVTAPAWRVVQVTDSMTDRVSSVAEITNEDGLTLLIARGETDRRVWAVLALNPSTPGVFGLVPPILRVDKLPAFDLSEVSGTLAQELGIAPQVLPKRARFLVWHGENEPTPSSALLRDLMDGESLLVRYFLFSDEVRETRFPLGGAKAAISEALGIPAEAQPGAKELQDAKVRTDERCAEMAQRAHWKKTRRCLDIAEACRYSETTAVHQDCLAQQGFWKIYQ